MIWTHAWKDIKRMLKDKKALLIILLMPALLTILLGFTVGQLMSSTSEIDTIRVAVVHNAEPASFKEPAVQQFLAGQGGGDSALSESAELDFVTLFTEQVLENDSLKDLIDYEIVSLEEANAQMKEDEIASIISFPPTFNQDVLEGMILPETMDVPITLIQHPDQAWKNEIVSSLVTTFSTQLSTSILKKDMLLSFMTEQGNLGEEIGMSIRNMMEEAKFTDNQQAEIKIEKASINGLTAISGLQYYTAGMAVMFMLYLASFVSLYTKDEIRNKTYDRIRASKSSVWHVLLGKFTGALLLTFLQFISLFVLAKVIFQIGFGDVTALLLVMLIVSVSVACLAVFLSAMTMVSSEGFDINNLFQNVLIPFLAMLGGSFIKTASLPESIQLIGNSILNGASLQAFLHVMQGMPLAEMSASFLAIGMNGIIFITLAFLLLWKKKEVF